MYLCLTIRQCDCGHVLQRHDTTRTPNAELSDSCKYPDIYPSYIELYCGMTTNSATAGWEQVEDKYYRKILLYSALWDPDFDLSDYIVAGAPYGGALGKPALWILGAKMLMLFYTSALYRDESKIQLQTHRGPQNSKSSIDIYSSAGKLIRQISV